ARGGDDDLARREILGAEHAPVVIDAALPQLVDLSPRRRPELRLQLTAEAAQRGSREHGLPRAADADGEMVVRPADGGRDRGGHVAVLDELDARACRADLLDQVVMAGTIEDDRRHVVHAPAECLRDRLDVLAHRPLQIDRTAGAGADGHLAHVHVGELDQLPGIADRDHRHRAVPAARDDAAAFQRVEREIDLDAARAERRAGGEALVLRRAEDDAASDRKPVERDPHARGGSFFRTLLVGTTEPAGRVQRRVLRRTEIRLAQARRGLADYALRGRRLLDRVGHETSTRAAAERTSSITSADACSALTFSITGIPSRSARPLMNVCSRRISTKWSR